MRNKIGVYICHCGSNISDYVDVEKVREIAEKIEGFVISRTTMFACADSAQKEIIQDIQEHELDAIVVASCSPKLHLFTFRDVAIRAGLNPYNYIQVNIREQCSWAHSDNTIQATEKAIKLVLAGIERAKFSEALFPLSISSENTIIVIGAGVTGMRAAIELAGMGTTVFIIEKKHYVGGRTAQWNQLYPSNEKGSEIIASLYKQITSHKNITLYTGATIISNKGSVGNYEVKVKIHPRNIALSTSKEINKLNEVIRKCPADIDDEFDFNLTKRKAVYINHTGQYPELPVIDDSLCTQCGECEKIFSDSYLKEKTEIKLIKAGAIILATGFDPYEPEEGEFEYKKLDQVITLQQFKRLIDISKDSLDYKERRIKEIVYIYCVGSRQSEGHNKYCSRYCCTAALHTSLEVKNKFDDINNYHFTRGLRTYGKQEIIYHQAINNGDLILQFSEDAPPVIEKDGNKIIVKIKDILTAGMELEVVSDLVVLVTGIVPRKDNSIADILKVTKGMDGFFNEVHPKLRPVETVIDGIYIAGTCQGPKNITESIQSALSAAAKANALISKGKIELEPTLAKVEPSLCKWCDKCTTVCPYDAISKTEKNNKIVAVVNESKCKGCGMCLPVCPVNAIQLSGYTDIEIESMIEALI